MAGTDSRTRDALPLETEENMMQPATGAWSFERLFDRVYLEVHGRIRGLRAAEFAQAGRHKEALGEIEAIERRRKAIDPQAALPIRLLLFKGFLYCASKQDEQAVEALATACRRIDESRALDAHEKEYLKCYASVCGLRSARRLRQPDATGFHVDFARVSLDVDRRLRRRFPLRQHPDWVEA
jgi:hypothetical protein